MYHLSFATVIIKFALSHLMLLSNCRNYIRSILLSYRVIWSFYYCYFVATLRCFICVNVN